VTPSTTTQTAGDPPGGDLLGEGLGEGPGGPGWEVGEEPGVGAPDAGGDGCGPGVVGDVPGVGPRDFPVVGDVPGVGTGAGGPEACGFGPRGPGLRSAGPPPGSDAFDPGEEVGPPARPGPGEDWPPGGADPGGPAAACRAPGPYSTVIAIRLAATATAAVSRAQ
jgi:phospholipid/cholesterol/gamma-HCH transport system substrate-binding protein